MFQFKLFRHWKYRYARKTIGNFAIIHFAGEIYQFISYLEIILYMF